VSYAGKYVLGVDSGTQGVRAQLYDLDGCCVGSAQRDYGVSFPFPGWAEQDPLEVWNALTHAVRECVSRSGVPKHHIVGICCDGTSSTVLAVDRLGKPLRPAILWMDSRAVDQVKTIASSCHPVLKYVGGQDAVEWMTPKALWLKECEPETYRDAFRLIETTDWFVYKMTGQWTASLCNSTCKWNYVSRDGGWSTEFLELIGLGDVLEKWPDVVLPMGTRVGTLLSDAADELGLEPGTCVAEGGIDAHVGMLGLGVTEPGSVAIVLGTSAVQMALSECPVFHPAIWGPYPDAVVPNLWLIEGGQVSAGSILAWFRDNLATDAVAEARELGVSAFQVLDNLASAVPPGANGLVVLDHFQGNRTPLRDPLARGAMVGLSLSHGKGHIVRAIYESLAFGTRHIFESWSSSGFGVTHAFASGGGSRSRMWLSTLASVCRMPVTLTVDSQAGCLGSAICASVAAGENRSLGDAAARMVRAKETVEPDPSLFGVYDFYYDKYLRSYDGLRSIMHEVTAAQSKRRETEST